MVSTDKQNNLFNPGDFRVRGYIYNPSKTFHNVFDFVFTVSLLLDECVYFIKNKKIDKYVQMDEKYKPDYDTGDTDMELRNFNGGNHQKWKFEHVGDGYYKIISVKSGMALSVMTNCENNAIIALGEAVQCHLRIKIL